MVYAKQIAENLLQIGAVSINLEQPFKWSSGWNSPVYTDNRKILSYPIIRAFIKKAFVETIKQDFPLVNYIAGVATAGIPMGALIADELNLPFVYVRAEAKAHGLGSQIEGVITDSAKALVVEDLVSTGESSMKAVRALRDKGVEVVGLVAIFTYGFPQSRNLFTKENVRFVSLCDLNTMLPLLVESKQLEPEKLKALDEWIINPAEWRQV